MPPRPYWWLAPICRTADAETLLRRVFDGIDFFAAGSPAGSQISRGSARTGVGIPWHPAAERFFATASRADAGR